MQTSITYKDAGVDVAAGDNLVERIKYHAKKTLRSEVLNGVGGFGALFALKDKYQNPILVSGTDGVGTKLKLAFQLNRHNTIGQDLVAMSVNDILVQGAEPLFFLDYFACSKLNVEVASQVISGVAHGCCLSGCSLIGGETAEMPDMYANGEYDLAGFAVGVVERSNVIDGKELRAGDVIIGLQSSGFHSNGYSLVRKLIAKDKIELNSNYDENLTWGEVLLAPTRIYVKSILSVLANKDIKVKAMAHITGGGITGNLARQFPENLSARVDKSTILQSKLFKWAQLSANLSDLQMFETFNCGIGYIMVVDKNDVAQVIDILQNNQEQCHILGEVSVAGNPLQQVEYV